MDGISMLNVFITYFDGMDILIGWLYLQGYGG